MLAEWFGALDAHGLADAPHTARWWKKDPAFDAHLRETYAALHAELARGLPAGWQHPRAQLAAVIVLDQFSRNMFRGEAGMFAQDATARAIAADALAQGAASELATHERLFLWMPFMHSESLDDQRRCLEGLIALRDQARGPAADAIGGNVGFARQHLEIIERFGRFPHRNAILGRESTPEERAFLQQPGSSF